MKYEIGKRIGILFFRFVLFLSPLLLGAETVEVIGTSDLHGDLEHFALLAPVIRRHVQAIKVDAGDLVQGNFVCDTLGGVPMVDALNALHYDLWVPGNHDFELGTAQLQLLRRRFHGTMAGAQWRFHDADLPAWCIVERNGIRCAFIALTEPGVRRRAELLKEILWRASERTALKKALSEIRRAKADATILIFHASLYGSYGSLGRLLYDCPGVDAVLCAHSHQELPGMTTAGAVVAQGGHHAHAAVLFKLVFDGRRLLRVESSLLRPERHPDPELSAIREAAFRQCRDAAREKLGTIRDADAFGASAAEAIRSESRSDAALTAFGTVYPGALNGKRLFSLMPYRNRIIVIECTPAALNRALAAYSGKRKLYFAGSREGETIRLALSDHLYFTLRIDDARIVGITPHVERKVIRQYLKNLRSRSIL